MYPTEIYPMLCKKRQCYKKAKGETATLEKMIDTLQWISISWASFQIEPCKTGTEVEREWHCDWNRTKEDEKDGSIHPTNTEWAGVGNTLECCIRIY